jgi:ATP-dependent helicase HepA
LETHFVVECIVPAALHVDRFLTAAPLRVVVDHANKDRREDAAFMHAKIEKGNPVKLLEKPAVKRKLFPAMMSAARKLAEASMQELIQAATNTMRQQLQDEINRLEDLRQINDHVRPEEIDGMKAQMTALEEALGSARLRLDALRLVLQVA